MTPNSVTIRKRFADVDGRAVHYRVAGEGVPIVLLHESPRSSRSLIPLLKHLGEQFLVVAPDTPGYGDSDALEDEFPPLSQFADALADFLEAIGIDKCVLYGSHTGGSIAAEFTERFPGRVAGLILDGYAIFTDAEKRDMVDNYLPPLEAKWDGSHLTSLWSRARDLFAYFPYHRRDPEHRTSTELFSLEASCRTVLGFLEAGDRYRGGYKASITHEAASALRSITAPTTVISRNGDLLRHHLDRIPSDSQCEKIAVPDEGTDWVDAIEQLVEQYGAKLPSMTEPLMQSWGDTYLDHPDGQLRIRRFGSEKGRPILYLHDLPGSGADAREVSDALGNNYTVIAPDLPGCADSDLTQIAAMATDTIVELVAEVLEFCEVKEAILVSNGLTIGLGCELFQKQPERISSHIANQIGPFVPELDTSQLQDLLPDTTPNLGGGYLTNAWFQMRDGLYYAPWWQRDHEHRRMRDPEGDVSLVQSKFRAWLKGPAIGFLFHEISKLEVKAELCAAVLSDADSTELSEAIVSL